MPIAMEPIGVVRSSRTAPTDDDWDAEQARIELDGGRFTAATLAGLADFSHVDVVYVFDQVDPDDVELSARHPRNNADWPEVGIFAQRAKRRPNRIGVTACRLVRVDGLAVHVEGLDAVDGTPVLDLKPVMAEFLPRSEVVQPAWSRELMRGYW